MRLTERLWLFLTENPAQPAATGLTLKIESFPDALKNVDCPRKNLYLHFVNEFRAPGCTV